MAGKELFSPGNRRDGSALSSSSTSECSRDAAVHLCEHTEYFFLLQITRSELGIFSKMRVSRSVPDLEDHVALRLFRPHRALLFRRRACHQVSKIKEAPQAVQNHECAAPASHDPIHGKITVRYVHPCLMPALSAHKSNLDQIIDNSIDLDPEYQRGMFPVAAN